jgi:glycosyltransferase involved in cell wall biosynthesis
MLEIGGVLTQNFNPHVAVVVAALNEESGIGPTISEIQEVLTNPHLLVVDGNSKDKTAEIAKSMGADVSLQIGVGKGDAMLQGIKSLHPDTRYVVFTDADYTYPAEFIPEMVKILEQSPHIGMVVGDRFHGSENYDQSSMNIFYIGNKLIANVQYLLNGVKLNDPLSGLRVVRADLLRKWKPESRGFDVEVEINDMVGREGYKIAEVPIDYRLRLGEKKLGPLDGIQILKRIIALSLKRGF